jgi:hypothetical protein
MDDVDLAATYGDAVYRVEASGCDSESVGSAFVIDPTHLVTNRHVVAIDVTPQLISRDGVRTQGLVVGWSEEPDIAVIEVPSPLEGTLEWAPTSDLSEGESLVVLGYPQPSHAFAVSTGSIQSFVTVGNQRSAVEIDAAVDYGSSGSPALTQTGLVAGVVTAVDPNPGGLREIPLMLPADQVLGVIQHLQTVQTELEPDCRTALGSDSIEIAQQLSNCGPSCPIVLPTLEGETPHFPESIEGFRNDGQFYSEEVRVFPDGQLVAPFSFPWADHDCDALWTARWKALAEPNVTGVVVPPYYSPPESFVGFFWPDPGAESVTWTQLMGEAEAPASSAGGFLAGSICELPAWFSEPENDPFLIDIVVDWVYWTPAP